MYLECSKLVGCHDSRGLLHQPVSFSLEAGKILSFMGENGIGKTTLVHILAGLDRNFEGGFNYLRKPGGAGIVDYRRSIWLQPQQRLLFDDVSVVENIDLSRLPVGQFPSIEWRPFEIFRKMRRQRVLRLSGGEKKMLAHLCAINSGRSIWLLDEPCAGLNKAASRILAMSLRSCAEELGKMIIIADHDAEFIDTVSDAVITVKRQPNQ